VIETKTDTEREFYDWLSRVEEAGRADADWILGCEHGYYGWRKTGHRSEAYTRGLYRGEGWRERGC
jgi:hypothetical protein